MKKHILFVKNQNLIKELIAKGYTHVEKDNVNEADFVLVIPETKRFESIGYGIATELVNFGEGVRFSKFYEIFE